MVLQLKNVQRARRLTSYAHHRHARISDPMPTHLRATTSQPPHHANRASLSTTRQLAARASAASLSRANPGAALPSHLDRPQRRGERHPHLAPHAAAAEAPRGVDGVGTSSDWSLALLSLVVRESRFAGATGAAAATRCEPLVTGLLSTATRP